MKNKNLKTIINFTLFQQIKTKSFKVAFGLVLILIFIGIFLMNLIPALDDLKNKELKNSEQLEINIDKIYCVNNSDIELNLTDIIQPLFKDTVCKNLEVSKESFLESFKDKNNEVVIAFENQDEAYIVEIIKPVNGSIEKEDVKTLSKKIPEVIKMGILESEGVSLKAVEKIMLPINSDVINADEESKTSKEFIAGQLIPMLLCLLLFYITFFYGQWVASSVVSEKTSRIMELLLTSVKPLELITGKCIAMGILAIIQCISIVIVAGGGHIISKFVILNFIDGDAKIINVLDLISVVSLGDIIMFLIFFILGYILYSLLNVLAGSTVSKNEDLQSALMPVQFIGLAGFYLAYIASVSNIDSVISKFALYVPLSSPFYLPAALLTHELPLIKVFLSLLMLFVTVVVVAIFTSRVYTMVILHTGNRIKLKELIDLFKKNIN